MLAQYYGRAPTQEEIAHFQEQGGTAVQTLDAIKATPEAVTYIAKQLDNTIEVKNK